MLLTNMDLWWVLVRARANISSSDAGVCAALSMGRLIASMLYGLRSWYPITFAASAALLIAVAMAASWIPARRAAGVNSMRALRHE